ncbi:MAG: YfhO family protein, partial [Muribaculaceae bacterium]|nr:YfhO family protein [Muribaculaceae bacterium]
LRHQAVIDAEQAQLLGVDANLSPISDSDEITLTSYAPDRLTYQASSTRGGLAVLSEVWFPWGWKAYIDGKETPVGRVNYLLRAVNIPAGNHSIELVFAPETVNSTVAVAKAAISLIYIWVLIAIAMAVVRLRKQEN